MKKETRDAWLFLGLMLVLGLLTALGLVVWGIKNATKFIGRIFGWKEKTI